ncbi:MAG TPA: hypothetical protein VH247_04740 [Thermoleophilaceae bacterium]|nr:hypothetical protein [Thermoleophilaceae bacterium]
MRPKGLAAVPGPWVPAGSETEFLFGLDVILDRLRQLLSER